MRVQIVVDPRDWRDLAVQAARGGTSRSAIVRDLVRRHLASKPDAGPAVRRDRRRDASTT